MPPISKMDNLEWLQGQYLEHVSEATTRNLDYLHSSINWSLVVITASSTFITSSFSKDVSLLSVIIVVFLVAILTHFFVRAAKAYMNVMRYSTLEKMITSTSLAESPDVAALKDAVMVLEVEWVAPLRFVTVTRKLLFDFGFFYFYLLNLLAIVYVSIATSISLLFLMALLCASLSLALAEVYYGLLRSPYFRRVKVFDIAELLQ